jgi:dTDP-glucose 4,6-dehydratase
MKKVLVSGSCGFIFSNFIRYVQNNPLYSDYEFVSVDKLVLPYNFKNILPNHQLYIGDIADQHFMDMVFKKEKPDIVINAAAESNVDESIKFAFSFVHSNVLGTQVMVDMSLKYGVERYVQVSTDECYGQLKHISDRSWTEESVSYPRNPYAASKYASELIVKAAHETHGLQYNITRCCNNFGSRQNPRNLVPKIITSILINKPIPIHGNGSQYREWLYVEDNCSAIMKIIMDAPLNETYNIGSGIEMSNLRMVENICKIMNVEKNIEFVQDRKGHDFRYSVDCTKLEKLGWRPKYKFDDGMKKTIEWYIENQHSYLEI